MKKEISQQKQQKGFTIIETLVAVTILMISITGPLVIASKGLTGAILAHDQATAAYLGQDAVEYVKNERDFNEIQLASGSSGTSSWLQGFSTCSSASKCSVDTINGNPFVYANNGITGCSGATCVLYLGANGYAPGSTNGTATKFSRDFYLKNTSANETTLVVEVTWLNGTVSNTIVFEDELFNIHI